MDGTSRIDSITDSGWWILGAVIFVVISHRILQTLTELAQACDKTIANNRDLALIKLLIMTVVGICSINIALSDEWCRSIVSALSVGIGFALRDVVGQIIIGMQLQKQLLPNTQYVVYDTLQKANASNNENDTSNAHFTVTECHILNCTIQNNNKKSITVPWTMLHNHVLVAT